MAQKQNITIAKRDFLSAWMILENLAVSLDQIGGAFIEDVQPRNGHSSRRILQEALDSYLTPQRVKEINRARMRLADYIPREEAEYLSEHKIPYWDYAGLKRLRQRMARAQKGSGRTRVSEPASRKSH